MDFGTEVRSLLLAANQEAERLGSDHTGTEHFVLAYLAEAARSNSVLYEQLGIDRYRVYERVHSSGVSTEHAERSYDSGMAEILRQSVVPEVATRTAALKATTPLTREAAAALTACRQAPERGTSELLVIEMLQTKESFAAKLLQELGVPIEDVVERLHAA